MASSQHCSRRAAQHKVKLKYLFQFPASLEASSNACMRAGLFYRYRALHVSLQRRLVMVGHDHTFCSALLPHLRSSAVSFQPKAAHSGKWLLFMPSPALLITHPGRCSTRCPRSSSCLLLPLLPALVSPVSALFPVSVLLSLTSQSITSAKCESSGCEAVREVNLGTDGVGEV